MSTIANITVALTADISGFTSGMKGATGSLRAVLKAIGDQQTAAMGPLQRYEQAHQRLEQMVDQGRLSFTQYAQALGIIAAERDRDVAAINEQIVATHAHASAVEVAAARMAAAQAQSRNPLTVPGVNVFQPTNLAQQGQQITAANLTVQERYAAQVALLNELLARGHITNEIYDRDLASHTAHLNDATGATARAIEQQERLNRLRTGGMSGAGQHTNLGQAANANIVNLAQQAMTNGQRAAAAYGASITRLNADLVRGNITAAQYAAGVRNATTIMNNAAGAANHMSVGMRSLLSAIHPSIGQMVAFGGGVGAAIVGINVLKDSISALVSTGFSLMVQFENVEISLATMYKSAARGKSVLEEMKNIAALTPMEFPEIARSGKQLAAAGIEARNLGSHLRLLTELASGSGTSIEELTRVYTRNMLQGRQYTRDINEFSNNAIPIWDQLAKTMGKSKEEIHAMVTAGQVGFREIMVALNELVGEGGRWEGATEAMQKSTRGLWSTTKDYFGFMLEKTTKAISETIHLKDILEATNAALSRRRNVFATADTGPIEQAIRIYAAVVSIGNSELFMGGESKGKIAELQKMLQAQRMERTTGEREGDAQRVADAELMIQKIKIMIRLHKDDLSVTQEERDLLKQTQAKLPEPIAGGDAAEKAEAAKRAEDIDNIIRKVKERNSVLAYGADVAERMKMVEMGVSKELLAEYDAYIKANEALERHDRKLKEQNDAQKKRNDEAKSQAEAIIKDSTTDRQKQIEKLALINELYQKNLLTLAQYTAAVKKANGEVNGMTEAQRKGADRGMKLQNEMRHPLEKYRRELAGLQSDLATGYIDQETFKRATNKLQQDTLFANQPERQDNKILLSGSSEALNAILRSQKEDKKDVPKTQLEVQQRIEQLVRQALAKGVTLEAWNP